MTTPKPTKLDKEINRRQQIERLIIENRNSLNDPTTNDSYDMKGIADDVIELIDREVRRARIDELKRLKISGTPDKMTDILVEVPEMTTKNDVGLLSIEDRIKMLNKSNKKEDR